MTTLPLETWIGNAAAVVCGQHGDVSQQARAAGCSRQTVYDHADKVQAALADAQLPGPSREQLLIDNAQLHQENRQLWELLDQSIDCPPDKVQQFSVTATAMGLSLSQILVLLAIILPPRRLPSRATLGRGVNRSARRAVGVLKILDKLCVPLILGLCLDEIFFRRTPVLMGIEAHSMVWVLGQRAADRSGATWAKAIEPWVNLQDVAADGGTGIERGLRLVAQARQQAASQTPDAAPVKPLHCQLDVFHTRRDGGRVQRRLWRRAEKLWDGAVALERALQRDKDRSENNADKKGEQGSKAKEGKISQAEVDQAWAMAIAAFEDADAQEKAWQRANAALQVFRPNGQLNDRQWAQAELQVAAEGLTDPGWDKVKRQLSDERTLTFLDRLHDELATAEPDEERRQALVALWRWRRESRRAKKAGEVSVAEEVLAALTEVVRGLVGKDWEQAYGRVSRVLVRVMRASSAVECVNSVVRMHQARHKNLSQELLDLKRLFWNCRGFLDGKRKGRSPYQLLGLNLSISDPWQLLQMDPAELEKILSSPSLAA